MSAEHMRRGDILPAITIESAAAEGVCVARYEGLVLFVKGAAPGDVADIEITWKKKKHAEGKIHRLITPSAQRQEPFCSHFGLCGGCKWQQLKYEGQLAFKQQQVLDAFQRVAKVDPGEVLPILGSELTRHYRNKLDLTFSAQGWTTEFSRDNPQPDTPALGFNVPGRWDKVIDLEKCHLMDPLADAIRLKVRELAVELDLPFYHLREHHGVMRNLIIRNTHSGEWMVIIALGTEPDDRTKQLFDTLVSHFPQITTLVYVVNTKKNSIITDLEAYTWYGSGYLTEVLEGLHFRIRPKSFFQTNSRQTMVLYNEALRMAALKGGEHVYDLYTGTGTIALFMARHAAKVTGIEYVEQAVIDARENAAINGIGNTEFFAGDMKEVLNPEFIAEHGTPDVIITDPPRDGMHPDVVKRILEMNPERVVYVSCNPATQARDIALMAENYTCASIRPVDMFPHTSHVENIALLVRKS